MKKKCIIILIISLLVCLVIALISYGFYIYSLNPVDEDSEENITFQISSGETLNTIIDNLKSNGLIKNTLTMKVYTKLNPGIPQAGTYILNKSMSAKEIYESIIDGRVTLDTVWVTFIEGKRLTNYASVISEHFPYTDEEVMAKLDDVEYLKVLIDKYDFLTEDILNEEIYHPLEGYLFPDTYEFLSDATLEEIIERMLDQTNSKLLSYTALIDESKLSIHEIMTLSSIVELEGARSTDRKGVAGVFYNRLDKGMTLGSDVTTYYAVGKDFSSDLTWSDLNSCNGYNTRGSCVKGLPVGPIASFSLTSLDAVLNPVSHDYLYFVADINGNTYFSKTSEEHSKVVSKLKSEGLWYEY